ncbi:MAG TPA: OmpH family outer membrane protein [Blastocatellia bacterium]|nr:OmpH family outer membrane protein [Blastocatellia bacterium]
MVKKKFAALAALMIAAVAAVASAQQATQAGVGGAIPDGKIVVINTQKLPGAIGELRQKYEQVDNQFKPRYSKLEQMANEMKTLENDIRTKGPSLAQDKLAEMQARYDDLKKQGTREQEDLKGEIDKALATATKPVWDKVTQFLQSYAAQRGIVMIIDLAGAAQTGSLAYISPGTDVTDDFVNEYNKANPVAGAAAPAQPKPQTTTPAAPVKKP